MKTKKQASKKKANTTRPTQSCNVCGQVLHTAYIRKRTGGRRVWIPTPWKYCDTDGLMFSAVRHTPKQKKQKKK